MKPKSGDHMPTSTTSLWGRCKMANSSSEDKTDILPERPARIQPYQFEPVRQDFERVPEHCVSFRAKPHAVFHGVCEIALTETHNQCYT